MIRPGFKLFFRWWVRQLAQLIPARLLQLFLEAGEAVTLEITEQRFVLFVRRKGKLTPVAQGRSPTWRRRWKQPLICPSFGC